jgi:DNA repair photolyase
MTVTEAQVRSILTRSTGYLRPVASHSLQPYRGCTFGRSLCGVGCYVQHNAFLTHHAAWGSFLEARVNAAAVYDVQHVREREWAHRRGEPFAIFMSSSTDPFVPQEARFGVTRQVLEAMVRHPPDTLILQTHSHRVTAYADQYRELARRCDLRVHISIESDRDRLPGLPPPSSTVEARLDAAAALRAHGVRVVVTCAPLFPIADPRAFFAREGACADAVVLDHFIGGDGSPTGSRTLRTALPEAMAAVDVTSTTLEYRDRMADVAREVMPGRVGVGVDGFAGRSFTRGNPPRLDALSAHDLGPVFA